MAARKPMPVLKTEGMYAAYALFEFYNEHNLLRLDFDIEAYFGQTRVMDTQLASGGHQPVVTLLSFQEIFNDAKNRYSPYQQARIAKEKRPYYRSDCLPFNVEKWHEQFENLINNVMHSRSVSPLPPRETQKPRTEEVKEEIKNTANPLPKHVVAQITGADNAEAHLVRTAFRIKAQRIQNPLTRDEEDAVDISDLSVQAMKKDLWAQSTKMPWYVKLNMKADQQAVADDEKDDDLSESSVALMLKKLRAESERRAVNGAAEETLWVGREKPTLKPMPHSTDIEIKRQSPAAPAHPPRRPAPASAADDEMELAKRLSNAAHEEEKQRRATAARSTTEQNELNLAIALSLSLQANPTRESKGRPPAAATPAKAPFAKLSAAEIARMPEGKQTAYALELSVAESEGRVILPPITPSAGPAKVAVSIDPFQSKSEEETNVMSEIDRLDYFSSLAKAKKEGRTILAPNPHPTAPGVFTAYPAPRIGGQQATTSSAPRSGRRRSF